MLKNTMVVLLPRRRAPGHDHGLLAPLQACPHPHSPTHSLVPDAGAAMVKGGAERVSALLFLKQTHKKPDNHQQTKEEARGGTGWRDAERQTEENRKK